MIASVSMASLATSMPAAIERALALFEAQERPADIALERGFVDLLGAGDINRPYFAQRSMQSRLVPPMYEHFLHPLAMRMAMGRKAPGRREEQRIALSMLDLCSGDRVLDVACGPGNFTRCFANVAQPGLVVGLDASSTMLTAAVRRTKSANVAYLRGDACALPFQASSFDAVNCFGAMHLFEQPMQALEEFVRVLAPGGRMALLTTCDDGRAKPQEGSDVRKFNGWLMFGREQLTGLLRDRGLLDVEQRAVRIAQFVSARKPASA
jgi:SAM-dependent methyltransferase